jgi:hypothetical protein
MTWDMRTFLILIWGMVRLIREVWTTQGIREVEVILAITVEMVEDIMEMAELVMVTVAALVLACIWQMKALLQGLRIMLTL